MDQSKLEEYLKTFLGEDDAHPEVRRFIEDLLIKMEFGHFEKEKKTRKKQNDRDYFMQQLYENQ